MDQVWVEGQYRDACEGLGLTSAAAFVRFFGTDEPPPDGSYIRPCSLPMPDGSALNVHYKQIDYARPSWRFACRWSKSRREFENYASMERLGVRCAQRIACGELRDRLHRLQRAFILTVTIPDAVPVSEFVRSRADAPGAAHLRSILLHQLADMTRRAHAGGFIHSDLFLRNILVSREGLPSAWWIDSPRGAIWRWLRPFGRVRDLASLDRGAASICTRAERLRFLHEYVGGQEPRARLRDLLWQIATYKMSRWQQSPDWRRRALPPSVASASWMAVREVIASLSTRFARAPRALATPRPRVAASRAA